MTQETLRSKEQMQITPEQAVPVLEKIVGELEEPLDQIVSVTHNPKSGVVAVETHFYSGASRGVAEREPDKLCVALKNLEYYYHEKRVQGTGRGGGSNLLFMIPETEFMNKTAEVKQPGDDSTVTDLQDAIRKQYPNLP